MTASFPNRLTISLPQSERDHLDQIAKHSGLGVGTVSRILLTRALSAIEEDDATFVAMLRFAERHGPAMEEADAQHVPARSVELNLGAQAAPKRRGAGPGSSGRKPPQSRGGAARRKKAAK